MHGITSCIHSILATCGTPVPGAVPPVARTAFSAWGRMHMTRFDDSYDSNPAENYERFFTTAIGRPLAEVLVERADVQPGERVLDVACGTGICARLVATTVGPKGAVAGLDANPAMLAVARQVAPAGMDIAWYEAPAERMPLDAESFDVALCQMGLQFMPSPAEALREMWRVLDAEGRLLVSVPGPAPPLFAALEEALEHHVGAAAAGFARQVFALHELGEVGGLLVDAGFADVRVDEAEHRLPLPGPERFLWQYIHGTPLAVAMAGLDTAARARFERDVLDAWAAHETVRGLELRVRLVTATGRKTVG